MAQKRMCRDFARARSFQVVREYEDPGVSGWATGNRPQYLRAMRAAESREFEELLVMDLSRLSRNKTRKVFGEHAR